MRQAIRRVGVMAAVSAGALALGLGGAGCSDEGWRDAMIRANLSPEMSTLYQRPVDVANDLTIMDDTNWRMFNQDLGRALYLDRPSRLTRERVPH